MGSAAFGYGKSDNSGQQSSESDTYGYSGAQNTGVTQSAQDVFGPQAGALGDLYSQARSIMGGGGAAGAAQGVAGQGVNAWQQAMQPGANPFFDQSVQAAIDQASEGFKRNVLPELESRGVGAGAYGNSRDQLARGEAAGQFGTTLQQTAAQQYAQQYAGDQSRQAQLIGLTPAMQQTQYAPLSVAASLIGGPTVLGQSSGFQQGSSFGEQMGHSASQGTTAGSSRQYDTRGSFMSK